MNAVQVERIPTSVGDVPTLFWLPQFVQKSSVIVAFHYLEGSKEVWLDGSFNAIFAYAQSAGIPFVACDMYRHGEWQVDGYESSYINDEDWDSFVTLSRDGITEAIDMIIKKYELSCDSLMFVGSSTGCLTAMGVINKGFKPQKLALGVPLPDRACDDEYSFHNNPESFTDCDLLVLTGTKDEEVEPGEVEWWFDQVNSQSKEIVMYESGHSLPPEWLERVVSFLKGTE